MSFIQFHSNEIDYRFICDRGQMAGLVGAIGAKWCFVHPTDKTAAGVCLDPRHRGTSVWARQPACVSALRTQARPSRRSIPRGSGFRRRWVVTTSHEASGWRSGSHFALAVTETSDGAPRHACSGRTAQLPCLAPPTSKAPATAAASTSEVPGARASDGSVTSR